MQQSQTAENFTKLNFISKQIKFICNILGKGKFLLKYNPIFQILKVTKKFKDQENIAGDGMEEDRWVEKLTSYAEIKPLCDSKFLALENISFGHIITEGYFLFRIRFIKNITTKMRILFKEREFEIKRIINVEEKSKFLNIIALEIYVS